MNITRLNFKEAIPILLKNVSQANFVALDFEMSGIESPFILDPSLSDSIQSRYYKTKCRIQRFIPLQLGLCAVKIQNNKVTYSPYNLYIYPLTLSNQGAQQFSFNSETMKFLAKNNFNFNKFFYEGIPFISPKRIERQNTKRQQLKQKQLQTKQYMLRSPNSSVFINMRYNEIVKWISQMSKLSSEEQKDVSKRQIYIDIQFIGIRAYESLQYKIKKEYPSLNLKFEYLNKNKQQLEKHKFLARKFLKITKLTPQELIPLQNKQKQQNREAEALQSLQLNQVWETIQKNKTPLIVHNGFLDLMHLYYRFVDDLPLTEDRYKQSVTKQFPFIYDTKYICNNNPILLSKVSLNTSLSNCYKLMRSVQVQSAKKQQELKAQPQSTGSKEQSDIFYSQINQECTEYEFDKEDNHEAGYDALMTAYTFVNAMKMMHFKPNKLVTSQFIKSTQYYCNKIPLGNIRIPYNFRENNTKYVEDATKQFYFTCLQSKQQKNSKSLLAKEQLINKYFTNKYGAVRIVWVSKSMYNFILTFIRPEDEVKLQKVLDKQGYCLYKLSDGLKYLISTKQVEQKQILTANNHII